MTMTSTDISKKIRAVNDELRSREAEFDTRSAEVADGVEGAGKKITEVNAEIERLKLERRILERALQKAEEAETAERVRLEAQECERHFSAAQANAKTLLQTAEKADNLLSELNVVLDELTNQEKAVWSELRLAKKPPGNTTVGRRGVADRASTLVTAMANGQFVYLHDKRGIADFVSIGWAYLLEGSGEKDAN
ncbi:hypothetical protein ACFOW6_16615 [Fodinicurvata halophila]|uniref:Uncharacterized protein n=1 Tax=Fodinicurvata halophila TaxID=1419723 RepID=A0ABV8UPY3_9PROT